VLVLIDYREVLALMEANVAMIRPELREELKALLEVMVLQYFSRYSATVQTEHENWMTQALAANNQDLDYCDSAQLAMQVSMLIVKITQEYLPSFYSHCSRDCAGILNITMRGTVAQLEIDPQAFQTFVTPINGR